jgi:hypothetical protein
LYLAARTTTIVEQIQQISKNHERCAAIVNKERNQRKKSNSLKSNGSLPTIDLLATRVNGKCVREYKNSHAFVSIFF